MKALIVLENHFYLDKTNTVWCDRVVDYNYLQRYLNVFEKILVTGRTTNIEKVKEIKLLVSGERVKFVPMPEFIGAKGLLKNLVKLKRIIRENTKGVDCVIYRAPTHLSLFTYKEVLKQNKKLGLEFMMAADKMFDGNGVLKNILNKLIDIKCKKMCMKALGVSYVTEKILQEKYPCKAIKGKRSNKYFTASYSSIDLNKEDYYEQKWSIDNVPETFKIIHTGYMDSYRKGQKVLLKAIKEVRDKGYNVKLTLIGDGTKREEFEKLSKELKINDIVEFKGLIKEKKKILELLRTSHLLVFPTQSEGLPRTIIEAMSQGLPCLSSPVDGIPELLKEEFLIDYNNHQLYAQKIINLITDWKKMIQLSDENYKIALNYEKSILDKRRYDFYKNFELRMD